MALQSSGAISLNNVNVELGNAGTAAIGMGNTAPRDLAGVASGAISLASFYGKSYALEWSGDSIYAHSPIYEGINTSPGSLWQAYWVTAAGNNSGAWQTVNASNGYFSGNSYDTQYAAGVNVSNNLIRAKVTYEGVTAYGSWITYNPSTKQFSTADSYAQTWAYSGGDFWRIEGGGGLLRYRYSTVSTHPWISLT